MKIADYDFKHGGVMKNSMQSIPVGNGDLGANVWADKSGLNLLLSKTDAWSELHRLLKTGFLNLRLTPNPFNRNTEWRLSYDDGILYIKAGGASFEIYADANYPAYRLKYSSEIPRKAVLSVINYRDESLHIASDDHSNYHMLGEYSAKRKFSLFKKKSVQPRDPYGFDTTEAADVVFSRDCNSVGQYHHNDTSCYEFTLNHQSLGDFPGKNDPFLNRSFGFLASCSQMKADGGKLIGENLTEFDITVVSHTAFCKNEAEWVNKAYELLNGYEENTAAHKEYWRSVWKRSFFELTGSKTAERLTQCCIAQRYMTVCAGRGEYPIKFNGSIFANQPSPNVNNKKNYDFRQWGGPFWFQNTRLIYWAMLYSGDYDMMRPFFKLYLDNLPLAKYRTEKYFGHEGAFYPETMTLFGTYTNKDYGADREGREISFIPNPYIKYYYIGAVELCQMMIKYVEYTNDTDFLKNEFFAFAEEILKFYRYHFKEKNGKLCFYPSASLETWQDCADDTPTIAGLYTVSKEIAEYADAPDSLKSLCKEIISLLPEIPHCSKNGKTVIAPFTENMDKVRRNVENPELYSVFPFPYYGIGKENLAIARDTYYQRDIKESGGWQQHGIQAALLGLADEAEKEIIHNSKSVDPRCIYPAFFGPNYDWLPDQDNGANMIMTISNMLVQSDKNTIRILPAWDKKLNASFRLPVSGDNFIEAEYRGGELKSYKFDAEPKQEIIIAV